MSQAVVPFRHPLLRVVEEMSGLLDSVGQAQPAFLTTGEKETLLVGLRRQISRLEALEARTIAASGDVAEAHGTRHAGAWLAHETRQDPAAGRVAQRSPRASTSGGRLSRQPTGRVRSRLPRPG